MLGSGKLPAMPVRRLPSVESRLDAATHVLNPEGIADTLTWAVRRNRELLEGQRESLRLVQKLTDQANHPPPSQ